MLNKKKLEIIKISLLIILILAVIIYLPSISQYYNNAESFIKNSGVYAPIVYGLLMIIAILIAPIPASPLAIISGIIFGPWLGMIYTLISATIGACIAFLLARFFIRDYLLRYYENNKLYKKFEGKNDINIAYIVFLTRLMPQVSFDVVSYLAGLTKLRLRWFALATFLGMIPIVFIFSFFGYLIEPYIKIVLVFLLIVFIAWFAHKILKK